MIRIFCDYVIYFCNSQLCKTYKCVFKSIDWWAWQILTNRYFESKLKKNECEWESLIRVIDHLEKSKLWALVRDSSWIEFKDMHVFCCLRNSNLFINENIVYLPDVLPALLQVPQQNWIIIGFTQYGTILLQDFRHGPVELKGVVNEIRFLMD